MDAGCGPGGTALQLCEDFKLVEAYDYSQGFVDMMLAKKTEKGLENLRAYQGDSHKQNELTSQKFDLIFGCNLIDRLQFPRQWLLQSKVKEYQYTLKVCMQSSLGISLQMICRKC